MADRTVNMNGENGKGKHTIDSERCDIVETPTGIGNGVYYACGKCGTALDVWARDQDVRDTISDALEKSVIDPLGLLAGLMANVIAVRLRPNKKVQNFNKMWYKSFAQHIATQGDFGLESP